MIFLICLKMLLIHPRWSRVVPKHPPDPRSCFSTIRTPRKNLVNFLKSRNFSSKMHFLLLAASQAWKKAFGRATENRTCFSIFIFRSNVLRGAKFGTISNFLSDRFLIEGLVLKKIDFLTPLHEKSFKIKLKLLEKCSKKCSKNQKFFFLSKCF